MPKKDYTILYLAGAAGIAYLILKKPANPTIAQPTATAAPANLLSQGLSLVKDLFGSKAPAQPALMPASGISLEPTAPLKPISAPAPSIDESLVLTSGGYLSGFNEIPGTALAVIGACASSMMKPAGLGKTSFDWTKLIVPGVVIAGGYLLVKNLGLLDGASSTNNTAIANQTTNADQSSLQQVLNAGSQKTLSESQYNALAVDIFNQSQSFTGSISARAMDQIVTDLQQMKTIADIYALKIAFGVKQLPLSFWSSCQWLNINCTAMNLDTVVKLSIDADHLSQINNYFAAQGIAYKI